MARGDVAPPACAAAAPQIINSATGTPKIADFAGVQLRRHLPVRHACEFGEHRPQLFGTLKRLRSALRPRKNDDAEELSWQQPIE
jgi:hypothetical protein